MTKTKAIIQELLDFNAIEHYRSMTRIERVHRFIERFGCSRGVAQNVANLLSTYSAEELFHIYYKDLFHERNEK